MDYQMKRMKRKTVGIYITKEGSVEVRAPYSAPKAEIDRFVREKEAWILSHQAKALERKQMRDSYKIRPGGSILFLGREYPSERSQNGMVSFDATGFLLPDTSSDELRAALADFYRRAAKEYLPKAVERFAPLIGKSPKQVRITSAKTRWGSCSAKDGINLSWRLMFAPPEVIDYVVVHELAHLIELNHSPRFWAIVASIIPDYKELRQALNDLQETLLRQGW